MSLYNLTVLARDKRKKGKQLLKEGFIPAVMYGPAREAKALVVGTKDFTNIFREAGKSQIISIEIEGKTFPTLVHALERDPLSDAIIHIDFYQTTKGHKVFATIPLIFKGIPPGVRDKGGTLVTNMREVEVEAFPEALPPSFEVRLTRLEEFGDEIFVSDLVLPEGVNLITPREVVIVSLLAPRREGGKVTEKGGEEETSSQAEEPKGDKNRT